MAESGAKSEAFPNVPGYFILPADNDVIDVARLLGENARLFHGPLQGIQTSTITGGVPDASDQLPEGTIILSP